MSSIENRKIKVYAKTGNVAVFQDGSEVDAEVTTGYQFDNAFRGGALPGLGDAVYDDDREYLELVSYSCSLDTGAELTLRYTGRRAWLNDGGDAWCWTPNDLILFEANTPDALDPAPGSLPIYHLSEQTPDTQVRWFVGHIISVRNEGTTGLTIQCADTRWKANHIKIARDTENGITIPKIAFNVERDHPDYLFSIKDLDGAGTLGTGESDQKDPRATLADILRYLRSAYDGALVSSEILDPTYAGELFLDSDIDGFTHKPDAIVIEDVGFFDAVKAILAQWAPEVRIWVDPRTTQWRLIPIGPGVKAATVQATNGNWQVDPGPVYHNTVYINPGTGLSATPGAEGNRIRIYQYGNHGISQEFSIQALVGSPGVLGQLVRLVEPLVGPQFASGSPVWPVYVDTLPNIQVNVDDVPPGGISVEQDLEGVATAVSITSINQKTETTSQKWDGATMKLWDESYESVWKEADEHRVSDNGEDGLGMRAYALFNDGGGHDALYIPFSKSRFGNDHSTNEWKGCVIWITTLNGADVQNSNHKYTILGQTIIGDVGDGSPGLNVIIDAPEGTLAGLGFKPISDASATEDRFLMGSFFMHEGTGGGLLLPAGTGNNKRWEVGRRLRISLTKMIENSSAPHEGVCGLPKVWDESGKRQILMSPQGGYAPRNTNVGWTFGGGYGQFGVFRSAGVLRTPVGYQGPSGVGWNAPQVLNIEYETTITDIRQVRYPESGFGGHAYARYGYERTLDISAPKWTTDAQTSDYASLAEKLFAMSCNGHNTGTVRKPGVKEWGALIDLGVRVSLHSSLTQSAYQGPVGGTVVPGYGSTLMGFWAAVTQVSIDFPGDSVTLTFNSIDGIRDIALQLKERFGQPMESALSDYEAALRKLNERVGCNQDSFTNETPLKIDLHRVVFPSGKGGGGPGGQIPQGKAILGCQEAGIGAAGPGGSASSAATGGALVTHGFGADSTVWIDLEGKAYLTDETGAQVPGTVSGDEFSASGEAYKEWTCLPQRNRDEIEALYAAALGIQNLEHEDVPPILCRTKAGSTTTEIKVLYPTLPTIGAVGARLMILDYRDRIGRSVYEIDSADGDTITLVDPIPSDEGGAPVAGVHVAIFAKIRPVPNPDDFAPGSVPFKVGSQWCVLEPDGDGFAADYDSGTNYLDKVETGLVTVNLTRGIRNGNANVQFSVDVEGTENGSSSSGQGYQRAVFYAQDGTAKDATKRGYFSFSGDDGAPKVLSGHTMKIVSARGTIKTGPEDATYNVEVWIWNLTTADTVVLAEATGGANTVLFPESSDGSVAAPLAEIEADCQWVIGWRNGSAGENELNGSHTHSVEIQYVEEED